MSYSVVDIDKITHTERSKARGKVKKTKFLAERVFRLFSVDADGFCESKDWPYLWSGQRRKNHK